MSAVKHKNHGWSLLLCLLLIAITYCVLAGNHDIEQLPAVMRHVAPVYLAAGGFLMLLFVSSEALGIFYLLNSLSCRISVWKCLKYSFIGFYYCSITPSASGGQPAQIYYMNKDGVELGTASLSILIITVSYQLGILLVFFLMLFARARLILEPLDFPRWLVGYGLAVNACLVAAFLCIAFYKGFPARVLSGGVRLLAKLRLLRNEEPVLQAIQVQLNEYQKGADYMKKHPRILLTVLGAILIQILSRLSVAFVVYRAFGLHEYGYLDVLALQAMLALAVESLPLPGAVGAAEAGFLSLNQTLFGAGRLIPALVLSRGISFYAFLIISAAVTLAAHLSARRRSLRSRPGGSIETR